MYMFSRTIIIGFNDERFSFGISQVETKLHLFKDRTGYLVARITRTYRMDATRCQHVPGRHLPDIFITYQSQYCILISIPTNIPCPFLGKLGSTQPVEENGT